MTSESTERIDRSRKLRICARAGVSHVWLVNAIVRTVEVLRLDAGRWLVAATYAGSEVVQAQPFDAVPLDLDRIWPTLPSTT